MINGEIFYRKIKELKRELHYLKTAHFKTATTISTMSLNQDLSFSLQLDGYDIHSSQRAILTLKTTDNSNMVSACYLVNATPYNLNDRFVYIKRISSNPGEVKFDITVYSQNPSDYNTLSGGGSVNLNYTVQVVGSSQFNVSVAYKSILGGS